MATKEDSKKKALPLPPVPPLQTSPAGVGASIAEESSESENETEPARVFQRRVSTSKTLNGSVSIVLLLLRHARWACYRPSGLVFSGSARSPSVIFDGLVSTQQVHCVGIY